MKEDFIIKKVVSERQYNSSSFSWDTVLLSTRLPASSHKQEAELKEILHRNSFKYSEVINGVRRYHCAWFTSPEEKQAYRDNYVKKLAEA